MPTPADPDARLFYRVALDRFDDAGVLLADGRTTGAVYLAGYSVECMLKALVLATVPAAHRPDVLDEFRGAKAHNFDWLRDLYRMYGGPHPPPEAVRALYEVNGWGTALRYRAGTIPVRQARQFLAAARKIMTWADGRL
ncbi:MAG: HEPN domain-containing protein [Gemmataceae bacterium]